MFIEHSVTEGIAQSTFQLRGVGEPSSGGLEEVLRHIDHHGPDESSCFQEFRLFPAGADRSRSMTHRPAVIALRYPWRDEDREVGGPASRPEEPSASSQHGELGSQSTEDVCVNDRVEGLGSEGKPSCARNDGRRPLGDALNGCSILRGPHPLCRYVCQDDRALRSLGQVQTRPASTRTNIEQTVIPSQAQHLDHQVGLRQGRVAVRPEVGADDQPLELSRSIGASAGCGPGDLRVLQDLRAGPTSEIKPER